MNPQNLFFGRPISAPFLRVLPGMKRILAAGIAGILICLASAPSRAEEAQDFLLVTKTFEDKLYDLTKTQAQDFLQKYPASPDASRAQFLIGRSLFELKKPAEALPVFENLSRAEGLTGLKDQALFWTGECYFRMEDYTTAIQRYQKIVSDFPTSDLVPIAQYSIGWSLERLEKPAEAIKAYEDVLVQGAQSAYAADSTFNIGRLAFEQADYDQAGETLRRFTQEYPLHAKLGEAFYLLGETYFNLKDYPEALKYFKSVPVTAETPEFHVYLLHGIAWTYFQLERYEESLEAFSPFVEEVKGTAIEDSFLFGRARTLQKLKRHAEAVTAFEDLEKRFPQSALADDVLFWKGEAQYDQADYEAAVRTWETLLTKFAAGDLKEKTQYNLAWAWFKRGDDDEAVRYLEKVWRQAGDGDPYLRVSAACQIGDTLIEKGKFTEAIALYDEILDNHPDSVLADYAQYQLAGAFLKSKNTAGAILGYQSLIQNYPNSGYRDDALYALGFAQMSQNDSTLAANSFKDLVRQYPESPLRRRAYYQQGICQFNLKDYAGALKIFSELKSNAQDEELASLAAFQEAQTLIKLGRRDEGRASLQNLMAAAPDSRLAPEALYLIGETLLEDERPAEAAVIFERFVDGYPRHELADNALLRLAAEAERTGDLGAAVAGYHEVFERYPERDTSADAARHYTELSIGAGSSLRAKRELLKIYGAAKNPAFKSVLAQKLGELLRLEGSRDEAVFYFREALPEAGPADAAQIQFLIGQTLEERSDKEAAVSEYLKVGYLYPAEKKTAAEANRRAAALLESLGRKEEAQKILDK